MVNCLGLVVADSLLNLLEKRSTKIEFIGEKENAAIEAKIRFSLAVNCYLWGNFAFIISC